jgi:tetratricopeptide (TPR) repeat protein
MFHRPFAVVPAIFLAAGIALAQAPAPAPQPDKPIADKPNITPELRGDIFMAKKQYREAIDAFREASSKDPVVLNKMGIAYHQLQQLDNALKCYQQAVRIKPDYIEAVNNIGTVYYAHKSFRRAITQYRKAIRVAPEDPKTASIYSNMGTALFARKQYKDASDAFHKAMGLDPDVFEHRSSFGVLLEERNVEERAKFHYYVAKEYAVSGRNDLALQYLRKAFEEGFKDKKQVQKDPEFAALRDLKEFKELMALEPRVL